MRDESRGPVYFSDGLYTMAYVTGLDDDVALNLDLRTIGLGGFTYPQPVNYSVDL